jgi:hypothetical protein
MLQRKQEAVLNVSKEVGLAVNTATTKDKQDKSAESAANFQYLEITSRHKNCIHEETNSILLHLSSAPYVLHATPISSSFN